MYENRNFYKLIEKKLLDIAPDGSVAISLRASLRVLPMLSLYSSSPHKLHLPIKPFGYWMDNEIRRNLLTLFIAYGISIRFMKPCSIEYLAAADPIFDKLTKLVYRTSTSTHSACRMARSNEYLFSGPRGRAYTATTVAARGVVKSISACLTSAEHLQTHFEYVAEDMMEIKEHAREAKALHARLNNVVNASINNDFENEKAILNT